MIYSYTINEFRKVNIKLILIIIILFALLPCLATISVLLVQKHLLIANKLSYEIIDQNTLDAWSSLLYPLLCMILVQTSTNPEYETNSLKYYQSTNINWVIFFCSKCLFIFCFVSITTLFNIISNFFIVTDQYQNLNQSITSIIIDSFEVFTMMNLYCVPIIFSQTLLRSCLSYFFC